MRTVLVNAFIIIAFSLFSASCKHRRSPQNEVMPKNMSAEKKGPGKIVFVKEIHNFGTLKDGETVSYSFIFRNEGGSPIKIVKSEKSCGCIDVKYDANLVNPGDSSVLEVVFNTAGEWGNQIKDVTIETSEGEQKELQIGAYIENKQFNNLLNTQK